MGNEKSRSYIFKLRPVPKPRMTQADRWKKRKVVVKYWEYADKLRTAAEEQGFKLSSKPLILIFSLKMAKTWSKKKKAEKAGTPHDQKPDTDNLIKAFLDAMTDEDEAVWNIHGIKLWTDEDSSIQVIEMPYDYGLEGLFVTLALDNPLAISYDK